MRSTATSTLPTDAYRSDRRKDVHLQENGYFILRFLAADLGKHLDHVLDTIIRTIAYRETCELTIRAGHRRPGS